MDPSAELRDLTAATWEAAVGHRFVDELWNGTLDPADMTRYLAQDVLFVDAFVALMGATVAAADLPGPRMVLARQLGVMAGPENDFFERALTGVAAAPTEPATSGFLDLMHSARHSGDYATCLAVLLVAEWLYLDWATRPGAPLPADPIASEWVQLHTGPQFTAWVTFLRAEFDRVGAGEAARAAFVRAVELELAFFDQVYA
jgi:thiaminase (transcriptional activator TenA)